MSNESSPPATAAETQSPSTSPASAVAQSPQNNSPAPKTSPPPSPEQLLTSEEVEKEKEGQTDEAEPESSEPIDPIDEFMGWIDDPSFPSRMLMQKFAAFDKKTQKTIILRAHEETASVPQGLKTRMINEYKDQPGGCLPDHLASKPLDVVAYAQGTKSKH